MLKNVKNRDKIVAVRSELFLGPGSGIICFGSGFSQKTKKYTVNLILFCFICTENTGECTLQ